MRCDHRLFVYQLTQNDKVAAKLYNNCFGKNVNKSEATSCNGNQYVKTWKTEPPPTKVEGFSGLERLRRTVGSFPTEVGGFKPDFWKMKQHEDDNLGFGIFEKVDKDLGLSRGTAWDASGWKDYCDIGFGDV